MESRKINHFAKSQRQNTGFGLPVKLQSAVMAGMEEQGGKREQNETNVEGTSFSERGPKIAQTSRFHGENATKVFQKM